MSNPGENSPASPRRFIFLRALGLFIAGAIAFATIVTPLALRQDAIPLDVGGVAPRDLQAPRTIEYVSEIRTEEARQSAALTVAPVYSTADPSIAREQIDSMRETLLFVSVVRVDEFASAEQKKNDLQRLESIQLEEEAIEIILGLNDAQWEAIQQESQSVLEQMMRNSIRQGDVASVQRSVPSRVSLALTETQAQLVAELVRAFIVPNSLYSAELTETARASASESVEPVIQRYIAGETVVSSGEVISAADLEALTILGLIQPEQEWPDYVGAAALTLTLAILLWLYFSYRRPAFVNDMRGMILVTLVFLIFLIAARLTIPNHAIIPYLYPLPAFGLLIATLFGVDAGFILAFALSLLTTYGLSNSLDLTAYYLVSSFLSILILRKAHRVWSFIKAGLVISATGVAMLLAYWLPFTNPDWVGIATLVGAAAFNGIASASLTLLLQFFIAQILGLTTTLQLLEISRPDSPLLQFFLRAAPGTYQHSLQVSNLAEQAAESIGADALLVRVGALYHDVGKAANPLFFIENQTPGNINTHEDIAPEESAKFIIKHVTDGVDMAKKHRLPSRLIDFILEHHGTNITQYQYTQALQDASGDPSKVDIEKFRYPGPPPRSRETALLMLADSTEAISRAKRPQDETELRSLVQKVIANAQQNGQLHDTRLTLRDLHLIRESFVATLRGTLHPRVDYPAPTAASGVPTKPNLRND